MRAVKHDEMFALWGIICAWQGELDWWLPAKEIIKIHGPPDPNAETYAGVPTAWLREWDAIELMVSFSQATNDYAMGMAYGHFLARQRQGEDIGGPLIPKEDR